MASVKKVGVVSIATLLLVTATVAPAIADGAGWRQVNSRNGVLISARPWAGSSFDEMQAIGDIDASPEAVLAVLDDLPRYPQFMPPTSKAQFLGRDANTVYYYMEISPPVIARRDYCIRVGWEHLPGGKLRSFWSADNSGCPPERRGVVRVRENEGEWLLEPIDDGRRTHVTYHCHIEVGGAVPAWMVNRVSATELPNVIGAVRKAVATRQFASACTTPPCRQ